MLILTRKTNEVIKIADDVEVVVIAVENGRVRLGIGAPKDVPVHRAEVYDRIKSKKKGDNKSVKNVGNGVIGS